MCTTKPWHTKIDTEESSMIFNEAHIPFFHLLLDEVFSFSEEVS
jgi:hypothetical protein